MAEQTASLGQEEMCSLCQQAPTVRCLQAQKNESELCALVLDIHDGLVQNLFAAATQVYTLQQIVASDTAPDREILTQRLDRLAALLEHALQEIRTFVRAFGPDEIHQHDVRTMIEGLASQRAYVTGMHIQVEVGDDLPHPPLPVKVALYRIVQEALSNAYRHGHATQVHIHVERRDGSLMLEIEDNGQGFDMTTLASGSEAGHHLGLRGMYERVRALEGNIQVNSTPGRGTFIRVELPC